MIRHLTVICLALLLVPQESAAQTRERIGYGRLITNDYLADGKDRWRSGSIASSRIWGLGWGGVLPQQPGEILELRLGGEIIAPSNLVNREPGDRPYAGALSAGLHTHFSRGGTDFALGADLVLTGPQTRLDKLQGAFHDILGVSKASAQTREDQIVDGIYPTVVVEAGRDVSLSGLATMRPFIEVRAGVETLARLGLDLSFGELANGGLQVRDTVSGHRYQTIPTDRSSFSFVLGADIASVESSAYLPSTSGVELRDMRSRVRGGVHWQGDIATVFYGLTYLGKEFQSQDEGQFVGSVRLDLSF